MKCVVIYYTTAGMDTLAKYLEGVFQELGLVLELDFQSNNASYVSKLMDPEGYDITPLALESDPISTWFLFSASYDMNKWDEADMETVTDLTMAAYAMSAGPERQEVLLQLEQLYYDNCWAFPIYDDIQLDGKTTGTEPFFNQTLYPDFTKWVVK